MWQHRRTDTELATEADNLATSFEYVQFNGRIYTPVDYETGDDTVIPTDPTASAGCPEPRPTSGRRRRLSSTRCSRTTAQLRDFVFMVEQLPGHQGSRRHGC